MSDFEQWFGGSKYTQVVYPSAATKQIALDGWNAAIASMQGEAVAIPWMTNGLFIITFHDFVEYGRKSGGNIVNGMPWSFSFDGIPVTHETDTCYLLCRHPNDLRIKPNTVLIKFADGSYSVQDKDTTFKDYPFLRRIDAPQPSASAEIARLQKELEEAGKWIAIAKSLAEEARDALPAISMASAKLHNIDLTLAERMDEHFTRPIDAAIRQIEASLNIKGGWE